MGETGLLVLPSKSQKPIRQLHFSQIHFVLKQKKNARKFLNLDFRMEPN